ncbi:MAG: phosphatase PAP2 family protein [Thermodesulfobacteriota bacterium]
MKKGLFGISWTALGAFAVLAAVFHRFPEIDLWVADLACHPQSLYYNNHPPVIRLIYHSVEVLTVVTVAGLLGLLAFVGFKKRPVLTLTARELLFLLLVLALGPGLVVNLVSKNISGRARPAHIEQFGGKLKFTPAFELSDQCDNNCSFVSGHASLAFYFISFAMIRRRQRDKIAAGTCLYTAVVGATRIYQGGHYLSDIIFACFFVYFTARMLHHAMFGQKARNS